MKTNLKFAGAFLIFCLPVMVCVTYVYSYFIPREYFSKVTLELKIDDQSKRIGDANFLRTQVQIIQSKEILYRVIDELRLADKWAENGQKRPKEEILARLLGKITVTQVRETNLVEIDVFSTDPQEAANIANTIAVQYRKRMIDDHMQRINLHLAELRELLEKQRTTIRPVAAEVERLRTEPASAEFTKARDEFDARQKMLNSISDRINSEKIEVNISFQPVNIWEKAEPALKPARPKMETIMAVGGGVGLLLAMIGGGLLFAASYVKDSWEFRDPPAAASV